MKEIELTKGYVALVDDDDYDELSKYKWKLLKTKSSRMYATRHKSIEGQQKRTTEYMHRKIMEITDPKIFVDHKNHNGLDNQRNNLRTCTNSQNNMNQRRQKNKSSIYKGVTLDRKDNKYRAKIQFNKKTIHLGGFSEEKDAAMAYDKKAKELFGEFAHLNINN